MKKVLVLLAALVLFTGPVFADGIGLTAGAEFGIQNVNKAGGEAMTPYLMPMLVYENSFFDNVLDLYAEADYTVQFADKTPMSLYLDLDQGFNLKLAESSTLTFLLDNTANILIQPRDPGANNFDLSLIPGVKFNQDLSFGGLYVQVEAPLGLIQNVKDAAFSSALNATLGWNSTFGLGIEVTEFNTLQPEAGYNGFEFIVSYTAGPLYAEVKTGIAKDIALDGVSITPEFDYSFMNFTAYVYCALSGIGTEGGNVMISPALGLKYSF